MGGFGTSDEAEAIEELLQAYDQSDADQIKSIVTKPLFRNLDNEVCYFQLCDLHETSVLIKLRHATHSSSLIMGENGKFMGGIVSWHQGFVEIRLSIYVSVTKATARAVRGS